MKNKADYSRYKCPYAHLEKECGHELHGPEGYDDVFGVWCACGFRGPVFYLDPDQLGLELKEAETRIENGIIYRPKCEPANEPIMIDPNEARESVIKGKCSCGMLIDKTVNAKRIILFKNGDVYRYADKSMRESADYCIFRCDMCSSVICDSWEPIHTQGMTQQDIDESLSEGEE